MADVNHLSHDTLKLARCPHCRVAEPNLPVRWKFESRSSKGREYGWQVCVCSVCGFPVVAGANMGSGESREIKYIYPTPIDYDVTALGEKTGAFLKQAGDSLHAPSGAIMLCAAAVDAMLKEKDLTSGSLYTRIDKAVKAGLITSEMAAWAHDVRLDANDERHADVGTILPTTEDAKRCIDFVQALAEFMFVLPARVQRGRKSNPSNANATPANPAKPDSASA